MTKKIVPVLFLLFFIFLGSCEKSGSERRPASEQVNFVVPAYAEKFRISYQEDFKILEIFNPWPGAIDTFRYYLYKNKEPQISTGPNEFKIKIPVEEIVCFSTTHLPALELLNVTDKLTGFPNTAYISSPEIRKLVRQNKIRDLGPSNDINFETLIALDPDVAMAFSMGNEQSLIKKILLSGIPVVLNADYLEKHPLGRAEWIKVMALLVDREQAADSIFSTIAGEYKRTRDSIADIPSLPTVFTGVVYGDTWFMPGGKHYGSIFFKDAGSRYLWSNNPSDETLQLSFESVYEKAASADYWIGTATYTSLDEIRQADERYSHFEAFQNGNVYNYTAKMGDKGGNAYFEEGYARPDIILKDLAKIFHPDRMKDHSLYFYEKLY